MLASTATRFKLERQKLQLAEIGVRVSVRPPVPGLAAAPLGRGRPIRTGCRVCSSCCWATSSRSRRTRGG